jgi:hypothetical protein
MKCLVITTLLTSSVSAFDNCIFVRLPVAGTTEAQIRGGAVTLAGGSFELFPVEDHLRTDSRVRLERRRSRPENGVNPCGERRGGTGRETDGGTPVTTRDIAGGVADVVGDCDDRDGAEGIVAGGGAVERRAAGLSRREFDDDDIRSSDVLAVCGRVDHHVEAQGDQLIGEPSANVVILQREQNDGTHSGAAG